MGKFDGKYVLEGGENVGPCMLALGMPEDMVAKMVDTKNMVTVTVVENPDGSFNYSSKHSLAPELDTDTMFKIGETARLEKPWPLSKTVTKTTENTWSTRIEMGDKTMVCECVVSSYGMCVRASIQGTALHFSQVFKRVSARVSGFYVFDTEKGLADTTRIILPQLNFSDIERMKPNFAFRITEQCEGLTMEKRIGDLKKLTSITFDEEYDYAEPNFLDEKRVTTKLGPGSYRTVCKSKKSGNVWENTMTFSDLGFSVSARAGGFESSEFYKRMPDIEGTWRIVAQSGMKNYLSALGVTGTMAVEMTKSMAMDYYTMTRLAGGRIKVLSNSKYFPEEMMLKVGETYSLEMGGMGTIQGVMTELKDTIINVWRVGGKTISITEKVSGNFMVSEYVVGGIRCSTMKAILARD